MSFDSSKLDNFDQSTLLNRRQELIDKGRGSAANLGDSDLEELVAIYSQLRRRSSGPPKLKEKKEKKVQTIPML